MQQKRLVILLADISGYTQFMLDTASSAIHGQMAINALIESIVAQVDIPMVLQEIEGDAVFLYAADPGGAEAWQRVIEDVSLKLDKFFAAFIAQLGVAIETVPCECAVCRHVDKLGLKIIVHVGEAMFHEVVGRFQVSGPDVILAHRLLKNSVESHEYLLLTEQAHALMQPYLSGSFERRLENCQGFGAVPVHVRLLQDELLRARDALYHISGAERQAAVDRHFASIEEQLPKAIDQQLRHPSRPFSWAERLAIRAEALLAPVFFSFYRRSIPKAQQARGRRRER